MTTQNTTGCVLGTLYLTKHEKVCFSYNSNRNCMVG